VNGGTEVIITGAGFRPGLSAVQVFFGEVPVPADDIKLLDAQTLWVRTPPGPIGPADVRVTLDGLQSDILEKAFDYRQPVQMNIKAEGKRIYDMTLDPTGVYLVAAAGPAGVQIYNVDGSGSTGATANPDELLDSAGALVASVKLPGGYHALGVATYFERNMDRVLVTAYHPDIPASGRLFVIGFDPVDISGSMVVAELPLNSAFARGIEARNNRAVIAMADQGVGLVDIHLQTRPTSATVGPFPTAIAPWMSPACPHRPEPRTSMRWPPVTTTSATTAWSMPSTAPAAASTSFEKAPGADSNWWAAWPYRPRGWRSKTTLPIWPPARPGW
jgi:hypothetical protein